MTNEALEELTLTNDEIPLDYAALAATELENAANTADPAAKRAHLDQAGVFATFSERQTVRDQLNDVPPPTAL